jgi:hypothetical protein
MTLLTRSPIVALTHERAPVKLDPLNAVISPTTAEGEKMPAIVTLHERSAPERKFTALPL